MEKHSKEKALPVKHTANRHGKIKPDISGQKLEKGNTYEEAEKEWNSKILKITLQISEQYPELSKYLEEMPVTIPVDKKPEIT